MLTELYFRRAMKRIVGNCSECFMFIISVCHFLQDAALCLDSVCVCVCVCVCARLAG